MWGMAFAVALFFADVFMYIDWMGYGIMGLWTGAMEHG